MELDEQVKQILNKNLGKRDFCEESFAWLGNLKAGSEEEFDFLYEDYPKLSRRLKNIELQEGCVVRNTLRARSLAKVLINENGKFHLSQAEKALKILEKRRYSLGPDRIEDQERQDHIYETLKKFVEDKQFVRILESISLNISNQGVMGLIRSTLVLQEREKISDRELRQAILAACFSYLRQSVGSCFATAPAILIHTEQKEQFLLDLKDLIERGKLQRVISGREYSVPINLNWGSGDWVKPFLLGEKESIHLHPGFMLALERSRILTGKTIKGRLKEAKKIFVRALHKMQGMPLSPQSIFKTLLEEHFKLSKEKIEEGEQIEQQRWRASPLLQERKASKNYTDYMHALAEAKSAFLSLSENPLLRSWEYTLASFAEAQEDFAKWNMFTSLGLHSGEPQGISRSIEGGLNDTLQELNLKAQQFKEEYDAMATRVDYQHARLQRARTEEDAQWLRLEYKRLSGQLKNIEDDYHRVQRKARKIASLLPTLMKEYLRIFPLYFQEVYDPDMRDISPQTIYDDSPAGFRLLYKFGRSSPDQWQLIYSKEQFIAALVDFFVSTENEILHHESFEGLDEEISKIVTILVHYLKTDEFLYGALERMGRAHQRSVTKESLQDLKSFDKKPWSYVSGGSLSHMIQCYYALDGEPHMREKKIEGEQELLIFFIDLMKTASKNLSSACYQNSDKRILAYSPTHAYLFTPGKHEEFSKAVEDKQFTYTYLRDHFIQPRKKWLTYWLDRNAMDWLIHKLCHKAPSAILESIKHAFRRSPEKVTVQDFMERFQSDVDIKNPFLGISTAHLDALIYQSIPFIETHALKERLAPIFNVLENTHILEEGSCLKILELWVNKAPYRESWDSTFLQNLCVSIFALVSQRTFSATNLQAEIYELFQKEGLAIQQPILFADSNWTKYHLGFIVSPSTSKLELWALNVLGSQGIPLSHAWAPYIDGRAPFPWGIYSRPQEYMRS